ncbi:MAG: multidrug effflux MFS transporter [Alphaproteobacteria bacterium]|nr:multidrug effflux MFS transporter [Alphaproteobacteria bacterium]
MKRLFRGPRPALAATAGTIVLLTAMTALGHFANNIFLPSLPAIARDLGTPISVVQLALTVFLATLAVAQLVVGPLADRFGRRPTILAGLILFMLGSAVCAQAPAIDVVMIGRVLQAAGAGASLVAARAVTRDAFAGPDLARVMATTSMGFSVVPSMVPFLGGAIQEAAGWRWSFWAALAVGAVVLLCVLARLPETNREHLRFRHPGTLLTAYLPVIADRRLLGYAAAGMGAMGGLFAFYAGSPTIFIERLGISPTGYGLYPPISVMGFLAGSVFARRNAGRIREEHLVAIGLAILALGAIAMVTPPALGLLHRFALIGAMAIFVAGLGIVMPISMAAALRIFPDRAGTAAALLGFLQMSAGALGAALASALKAPLDVLAFPTAMLVFAVLALLGFSTLVLLGTSARRS